MTRAKACLLIVLAAGLVHAALGLQFLRASSQTFDEGVHLAAGYSYWKTGDYRLNIQDHPPLAKLWAALPLLALRPDAFLSHPDYLQNRQYHYGDLFLRKNIVPAAKLLGTARTFTLLTWGALLLALIAAWAWRLGGPEAAACAAVLFAFSPYFYANEALITTDAASAFFYALSFFLYSKAFEGEKRPLLWAALGSFAAGLALASKFSLILLPPVLLGMLVVEASLRRLKLRDLPLLALAVPLGALAGVGLVYRLRYGLFLFGVNAIFGQIVEGHSAFFLGRHGIGGFFWYFPYAFLVKTPLPELLLGLGGLGWAAWRWKKDPRWLWLILPMAAYMAALFGSRLQIGHRHLLPAYPFFLVLAGAAGAKLCSRTAGAALLAVLLLWQAAGVLRVQPYALAYFNELAGGPENGYTKLVDSNLDWGQDLPSLAGLLRERGNPPVYLCYFGTGEPAEQGIAYHPVAMGSMGMVERPGNGDPLTSDRLWLAVSATNLQSTYYKSKDVYAWLLARKPEAKAGWSIFLYELSDAAGREGLARVLELDGQAAEAARLRAWKGGRA